MSEETPDTAKETAEDTPASGPRVVEDGSVVYVDYVARTKDDGNIFDLTIEEVAKQEGLFKESNRYEPVLVVVGWNWLIEAVEEELVGMEEGETKTIEVPPERGVGPHDPKKVKMIAKTKLIKMGVKISRGEEVVMGGERGVITQVLGRRARVDFNSPLAGKTLVFEVTVREILQDTVDVIRAFVKRRIPGILESRVDVSIEDDTVTIGLPLETRYVEGVQYAEIGIARDTLQFYKEAKRVRLVVTFERPGGLAEDEEEETGTDEDVEGNDSTESTN